MSHRGFFRFLCFGAGILLLIVGALVVTFYLRPVPFIKSAVPYMLGRPVQFGFVRFDSTHPSVIEADDVDIANRPWGRAPDIVHIGHLFAILDLSQLWRGRLNFRQVKLDDVTLLLERNAEGVGNWKQDSTSPPSPAHSRHNLPVILDLAVTNSKITMYTSSNNKLTISFDKLLLHADDAHAPVHLTVQGAYNDIPVRMDIETQPFDALRDADHPFGARVDAKGNTVALTLDAKFMDPLNADQFEGPFHLTVGKIGRAAAYIGSPFHNDTPLALDGQLQRRGDSWTLADMTGNLNGNIFNTSFVKLQEGARRQPDSLQAALRFDELNVTALLDKSVPDKDPAQPNRRLAFLDIADHPGTLLDLSLSAGTLVIKSIQASRVELHASLIDGKAALDKMTMDVFGGSMRGALTFTPHDVTARLALIHAQAQQMLLAFHKDGMPVSGQVAITADLNAAGNTAAQLKQNTHGPIAMTLTHGRIAARIVHLAAMDVESLFDKKTRMVVVPCAVAAVDFRRGVGVLSPFRFETVDGALFGAGTIDLPQNKIDISFQTDPKTTSALALDVPITVVGDLDAPMIRPAPGHAPIIDRSGPAACSD